MSSFFYTSEICTDENVQGKAKLNISQETEKKL